MPVGVGTGSVSYSVRSEDYTEQSSSYTAVRSFRTYEGIPAMAEGSGVSIAALPEEFSVDVPSPNPFNAATTVRFGLPEASHVRFDVYDIMGRHITTLLDENRSMGWHALSWNASEAASGTYFLIGKVGSQVVNQKLIVIK